LGNTFGKISGGKLMLHKKTVLSWMAIWAIAACSPAAAPVPTDTAVPTLPVATDTPAATAIIPNTGATAAPTAGATATVIVTSTSTLGGILTDAKGVTLYAFTKDTPGLSNCTGSCATLWPPLTVAQGATVAAGQGVSAAVSTLTRADGTVQVTVNGQPVYYYSEDVNPGDATGQGVGGFWFVLGADGNLVKSASSAPTAAPTTYP
jgi:predicted lipoprotein with Yx(FWY)xxD motif